jgi:hypothetical protein
MGSEQGRLVYSPQIAQIARINPDYNCGDPVHSLSTTEEAVVSRGSQSIFLRNGPRRTPALAPLIRHACGMMQKGPLCTDRSP